MKIEVQSMLAVARPLRYLLLALSLVCAVAGVSDLLELRFFNDFSAGVYKTQLAAENAASASDNRQRIIKFTYLATYVLTSISFLVWVYRSNVSARSLGAENMRISPSWAVGWFFVPFMSWWKPYQAMSDLWRASKDPHAWASLYRGSVLPLWWFFWLTGAIIGNLYLRVSWDAETIDQLAMVSTVSLISNVVDVPTYLLTYMLVGQISKFQTDYGSIRTG